MSTIRRQLPETHDTRLLALQQAKAKLDTLPPASNPLSMATTTRLTNSLTDFLARMSNISLARAAYSGNTAQKNAAEAEARMWVSHYYQVFNLGVARGEYAAADRAYYNLPIDSSALPDMVSEADLALWGNRVSTGEAARVGAGGTAMSNPTQLQVKAKVDAYVAELSQQTGFYETLDTAEEALEAILPETDKVIKKVWDELETYYNEESDESRRENCRQWGVVYVTEGSSKTLSGTVTYNGAPGVGLVVRFKSGINKSIVNAEGAYSLSTTLMDSQKIAIEKFDSNNQLIRSWEFEVVLQENQNTVEDFVVND